MNYYELIYMSYDGDFYNQEKSWTIETNKTYDEMLEYMHELNKEYKKIDEHGFFYINETWIYKQIPTYEDLLDDLREL